MAKIYQFPGRYEKEKTEEKIWEEIYQSPEYWYQLEHAEEIWQEIEKECQEEEVLCRLIQEGKARIVIDNEVKRIGHVEMIGGGFNG